MSTIHRRLYPATSPLIQRTLESSSLFNESAFIAHFAGKGGMQSAAEQSMRGQEAQEAGR